MKFEELIDECNKFVCECWNRGTFEQGSYQHRDIIRTFFAGAIVALKTQSTASQGVVLLQACQQERMFEENWWPDERFRVP